MARTVNERPDPYEECPVYAGKYTTLRLVKKDDESDLLKCYADPAARQIFNSDNCNNNFFYDTAEQMRDCIDFWLECYKGGGFVRFAIVDNESGKAIGTVEIFGGDYGVLRIDVLSEYETEAYLNELVKTADSFFYDFGCENIITKAVPIAAARASALTRNGYAPADIGDGSNREHYYLKKAPA